MSLLLRSANTSPFLKITFTISKSNLKEYTYYGCFDDLLKKMIFFMKLYHLKWVSFKDLVYSIENVVDKEISSVLKDVSKSFSFEMFLKECSDVLNSLEYEVPSQQNAELLNTLKEFLIQLKSKQEFSIYSKKMVDSVIYKIDRILSYTPSTSFPRYWEICNAVIAIIKINLKDCVSVLEERMSIESCVEREIKFDFSNAFDEIFCDITPEELHFLKFVEIYLNGELCKRFSYKKPAEETDIFDVLFDEILKQ